MIMALGNMPNRTLKVFLIFIKHCSGHLQSKCIWVGGGGLEALIHMDLVLGGECEVKS
jgi:hypothetical protein